MTADLATLVARALPRRGNAVLAVSGGLDSMALLDLAAMVRNRRGCALMVATFDHASGAHSARASSFVVRKGLDYGVPVVVGHAGNVDPTEAAWRAARWDFLRSVARSANAVIVTAHTRDDQLETVLMRAMRGAGTRGLAGLRAPSDVRRPLIHAHRSELETYARARGLAWLEDPTNRDTRYLRNRIRRDLLPSLLRERPSLEAELIDIGERAAIWRRELATFVDANIRLDVGRTANASSLDVRAADLSSYPSPSLGIVWPELASRVGLALDHRGTRRIADFTISGKVGRRIQLSGGWELTRSRSRFELRSAAANGEQVDGVQRFAPPMTWDRWAFASSESASNADPWRAALPRGDALWVRAWRPGDRLTIRQGDRLITRKVRYFLSDAGISGHIRARWPVVLAGNEIVWIPGVRRSDAASARSGRPVVTYACDYLDRRS